MGRSPDLNETNVADETSGVDPVKEVRDAIRAASAAARVAFFIGLGLFAISAYAAVHVREKVTAVLYFGGIWLALTMVRLGTIGSGFSTNEATLHHHSGFAFAFSLAAVAPLLSLWLGWRLRELGWLALLAGAIPLPIGVLLLWAAGFPG